MADGGGGKKLDPRTVFVRGVDAAVDDAQLQEFFAEVGPVKNAFLVRRGKDGPHRGFGFVQFAVAEDAARAAADLHGAELAGRKLKVEGAVKRAPLEERKKRKQDGAAEPAAAEDAAQQPQQQQQPVAKKPRPAKPARQPDAAAVAVAEGKHKWLRAVAVGSLTAETLPAALAMAKAAGEVEEVVQPVPDKLAAQFMLKRDGCSGEAFIAVYKSIKAALAAVAALHGKEAGAAAAGGKKGGKKGDQAATAGAARVWARQLSGEGLHIKRWRLIVRNLPFNATEAHLRTAFEPAGFVWELTLPRSASGRGRGFAFVGFTCKAHAERGIKLVNGQAVAGRPVAVDWAVAKAQYGQQQQQEAAEAAAEAAAAAAGPGGKEEQRGGLDSDLESSSDEDEDGPAAALGHESDGEPAGAVEPERERDMLASVIGGILGGSDDEAEEEGSEEEGSDEEGSDEELSGSEGQEGEGEGSEDEEGSDSDADAAAETTAAAADPFSRKRLQEKAAAAAEAGGDAAQQRQRAEPEEGATVFIRGLPLDVSKEQVFLKMKTYGPVRSCRLVVDKASGKLKGTAFVDFYKLASAEKAAEACAKGRRKEGPGVVIAGRVADVDLALGHDDVRALAVQKAAERGGTQSRRLTLAKEGQIAEGSPAWEDMSAGDKAKRKRAAEEKKLKLRSPNFVVSDMRLSVRNIPTSWTEKQLKAAFIQAVKQRASKAQPVVKQVKILMDEERTGADGTPRSKGIGFVEFTEHEHALCALRQLNNNPATFSKDKRPIVEFALENVKALKLREAKLAKSKQAQQQQPARQAADGPEQEPAGGKGAAAQQQQRQAAGAAAAVQQEEGDEEGGEAQQKSKRQLRKERRLMLKERRKQQKAEAADGGEGGAAAAANGAAAGAAGDKSKAAKRRELRKKRRLEARGLAPPAAAAAAAAPKAAPKAAPAAQPAKQQQKGQREGKQQQQQGKQKGGQQQQQQGEQKGGQQQQGKAQRPGLNSRAVKAVAAAQQEQAAQQRKRSADDLIDRLADGPAGALQPRKRKKEQTDNVDALAKQYVAKYFGGAAPKADKPGKAGGGSSVGAKAKAAAGAAMKRWFE
ncbi:RNA-binding 28 isoform A [Chlorella sorokiniana]|uniref:RNA-binding 28 isoform A n=1 Tax=Chlorella sorokiniana TaxID=3076 RepID=A0A2P6TTF5_CHLSO|nr:RNA-binding 28 isoform B [Chlorella sorokiniana]PRW57349.1 RNA-binding 28 isoform A [Chlorella sorokiniana]|eukprot:PRW57348.1 RNA-binding 28 isoform B [Chlorella sorokiniana]